MPLRKCSCGHRWHSCRIMDKQNALLKDDYLHALYGWVVALKVSTVAIESCNTASFWGPFCRMISPQMPLVYRSRSPQRSLNQNYRKLPCLSRLDNSHYPKFWRPATLRQRFNLWWALFRKIICLKSFCWRVTGLGGLCWWIFDLKFMYSRTADNQGYLVYRSKPIKVSLLENWPTDDTESYQYKDACRPA